MVFSLCRELCVAGVCCSLNGLSHFCCRRLLGARGGGLVVPGHDVFTTIGVASLPTLFVALSFVEQNMPYAVRRSINYATFSRRPSSCSVGLPKRKVDVIRSESGGSGCRGAFMRPVTGCAKQFCFTFVPSFIFVPLSLLLLFPWRIKQAPCVGCVLEKGFFLAFAFRVVRFFLSLCYVGLRFAHRFAYP